MRREVEQAQAAVDRLGAMNYPDWVERVQNWSPARDFMTRDTAVRFAVEGLIQERKVGVLAAAGGTGKTTVNLILGISIVLGRPFFGHSIPKRGSFVLLSLDDPQEDLDGALRRVMEAMGLSEAEVGEVLTKFRVISLIDVPGLAFTAADGGAVFATNLEAEIIEAVQGIPDLVGIALDTLRQFCGGSSLDEQVIKLTISAATRVAHKTGAFVIFNHHVGKQNFRDGISDMYAGTGSAAIADNSRFVLVLQTTTWPDIEAKMRRTGQERGTPLVLTSTRGSLLVRAPAPIYLHREGFYIGRVAGAALTLDQQADEKDRAILRAVRSGATTKTAVAGLVRGKKTQVLDRIDVLLSRQLLSNQSSQSGSRAKAELMVTAAGSRLLDEDL